MGELGEWQEQRRETVGDHGLFVVERSWARSPEDGSVHVFHRIVTADWAQIVPVTARGEIVMIRQYRHGAGRITLEIPGGLLDPGETPAAAAARELLEETGYRAGRIRPLGVLSPNPALFSNRLHTFVAEDAERVAPIRSAGNELTEVELVPGAELERLLVEGRIDHALVAATLWRYLHEARGGAGRRAPALG